MLHSFENTPAGFRAGIPSEAEKLIMQSVKAKKKYRKIADGTDGIDATDERDESSRLQEGFEMFQNDWD